MAWELFCGIRVDCEVEPSSFAGHQNHKTANVFKSQNDIIANGEEKQKWLQPD